jgi:hypothetical protein
MSKQQNAPEQDADTTPAEAGTTIDVPKNRLQRLRAAAEKRLAGTRAERVLKELPERAERELDGLLDRVGLVRKSRVPRPVEQETSPSA